MPQSRSFSAKVSRQRCRSSSRGFRRLPSLPTGPHAQVNVRVGLVGVQQYHVAMVRQIGLAELSRCAPHELRIGASWRRRTSHGSLTGHAGAYKLLYQ